MEHELQVMSAKGHTSIKWNPNNDEEIETAKASFDALLEKGFAAFSVDGTDQKGRRLTRFDYRAKEIILVPPISGG